MAETTIEWTDRVWNPITGCTKVSAGCKNCYAETIDRRFHEKLYGEPFVPWTVKAQRKSGRPAVTLHPERLNDPLKWRKPSRIFVNSMSDLFHEDLSDDFISEAMCTIDMARWHIFQVLTKRPERMLGILSKDKYLVRGQPMPNLWAGVSVENQKAAEERIPLLLQTPAAVRFLSVEPMLGPVDLTPWLKTTQAEADYAVNMCQTNLRTAESRQAMDELIKAAVHKLCPSLDWVICGGESGPKARPMHPDWVRSLRDQCQAAGVAFFFKQFGKWAPLVVNGPLQFSDRWVGLDGTVRVGDAEEDTDAAMRPVGKKDAGALLDGREHREFPQP